MEKDDKKILLSGLLWFLLLIALSLALTLFWGWVLQVVFAWVGLTIPYYVAVLWIMLIRYLAGLFKK